MMVAAWLRERLICELLRDRTIRLEMRLQSVSTGSDVKIRDEDPFCLHRRHMLRPGLISSRPWSSTGRNSVHRSRPSEVAAPGAERQISVGELVENEMNDEGKAER